MSEIEYQLRESLQECVALLEATAAVIFDAIPPQGATTISKARSLLESLSKAEGNGNG